MSGLEIIGVVSAVIPFLISAGGVNVSTSTLNWLYTKVTRTHRIYRKDGLVAVLLLNLLPGASSAIDRIDKIISDTGTDARLSEFRQSLSSSMNMVAVAGAIIAQVAITGLSLEGIDQAHWTAAAFLVASLIFGAISVYACFIVQQEVNGLLGTDGLLDWLSRPLTEEQVNEKLQMILEYLNSLQGHPPPGDPPPRNQAAPLPELDFVDPLDREASALAAIVVAAPSGLLGLSLNCFVFGFGIYLGGVYSNNLIPGFGRGGSLGILIFYIIAAATSTFLYTFPRVLKTSERYGTERTGDSRVRLEEASRTLRNHEALMARRNEQLLNVHP
ncbi:uncharacterized protein F4822DRAFT_276805 [Hypoxylon trugodes]|uniref:uncharacterized protein n=1 Tax=Hypoxylon trugodes TaxID=326681 RepID=UPI002192CDF2|nr:uncharacterized protein F4822DRAFT_276805 [Hypoxylon trugodes]KAI1387220.1 hypothetical protein F4822DRAFT_276805 [Hypoxylon trugodes]